MPHAHGHQSHHHHHHHDHHDDDTAECLFNLCLCFCACAQAIFEECERNSENTSYVSSGPSAAQMRDIEESKQAQVQQKRNEVTSELDTLERALENVSISEKMRQAGKNVVQEGRKLVSALTNESELKSLSESLCVAADVAQHPHDQQKIRNLHENAKQAIGKPSTFKKFFGALAIFAGTVMMGLGIASIWTGVSLGLVIGGAGLFAAGSGLIYHGRQKSMSKALDGLVEAEKEEVYPSGCIIR